MKYFIDTNIFLRFLIKGTKKEIREDCGLFLDKVKEGEIKAYTSDLVFSEIEWVLRSYYKIPKDQVIRTLDSILALRIQFINRFQTSLAIDLYKKYLVKFVDCQIASISEIYGKDWTIVSYDRDFDRLGIIRQEPREVVRGR